MNKYAKFAALIAIIVGTLVWLAFFFMNAAQPKGFVYFAF